MPAKLLSRALRILRRLDTFEPGSIPKEMGQPRLRHLIEEQPGYIQFMKHVLDAAKAKQKEHAPCLTTTQ